MAVELKQNQGLPYQVVHRDGSDRVTPRRGGRRWIRRAFVGALGLLLAGLAATRVPPAARARVWAWWDSFDDTAATEVRVEESVPETIFALAVLEPEGDIISVAAPSGVVDARIEQLFVEVGEEVRQGQALARLDNHDRLQASLDVARAQYAQAQRSLEQARIVARTTRDELLAAARSRKARLKQAEIDLRRQTKLLTNRAISRQAYDDVALHLETTALSLSEIEARLLRYPEAIEQAADVRLAASAVEVARLSVLEAEEHLRQSTITAPSDGKVLDLELQTGEQIRNSPLLKMGRTKSMIARAEVYESDLALIQPGQSARVHSVALPQALTGVVQHVGSFVQRQSLVDSSPAANTDSRVAEVFVHLSDESSEVASRFVGMQVRVEIER